MVPFHPHAVHPRPIATSEIFNFEVLSITAEHRVGARHVRRIKDHVVSGRSSHGSLATRQPDDLPGLGKRNQASNGLRMGANLRTGRSEICLDLYDVPAHRLVRSDLHLSRRQHRHAVPICDLPQPGLQLLLQGVLPGGKRCKVVRMQRNYVQIGADQVAHRCSPGIQQSSLKATANICGLDAQAKDGGDSTIDHPRQCLFKSVNHRVYQFLRAMICRFSLL